MSQVMLTYQRAQTFLPPREGLYLVWVGRIPKLALWNNIRWIDVADAGKVNPVSLVGVTYWAVLPRWDKLVECDPTIQDRKHEINPIEEKAIEEGVD